MSGTSRSLRNQILLYLFLSALMVAFVTEIIIVEKNRRSLTRILDETAKAYATALASLTEVEETGVVELEFSDEIMRDFSGENPSAYFLILRIVDGLEIERSDSLEDEELALPDSLARIPPGGVQFWDTTVDDERVRFIALREFSRVDEDDEEDEEEEGELLLEEEEEEEEEEEDLLLEEKGVASSHEGASSGPRDNEFFFIVGLNKEYIYKRLEETIKATVPALMIGLALMLFFVWIAVNRNLKPLKKLEQEVQSISASNMSPVTIPEVTEIASVARKLNRMITDLKEAFERERRFTSNVAHELRTPISEMRSTVEVALRYGAGLNEQDRKNYEDILASAKEMQKTVVNLLTLARCDSGHLKPKKERVELKPLIDSIWKELSGKATERGMKIICDLPSDFFIFTDEELLKLILQNLLCNAVSYVSEGGKIEWKAAKQDNEFTLSISNSVENFARDDLPLIFEPFWQKDKARTPGDSHSGLGLSLVKSLSDMLGFSVNASLATPSLLTMTISGKTDQLT